MSSVRLTLSLSFTAPIEIAPSALAGEGTLLVPSLPIATTQTIPTSVALLTKRASLPVPLSPSSPGFRGDEIEPKDIEPICIPLPEPLLPQSLSTLFIIH